MKPRNASPASRGALFELGAWTVLLLCMSFAVVEVGHLLIQRWQVESVDVPFNGWQVDLTEGLLVVVVVGGGCLSGVTVVRRWRALGSSAPYRLGPLLLGIAVGLVLGSLTGQAVARPVLWASNHTASAASSRAGERARIAEYRTSPVPAHSSQPAAPAVLAARLVHTSDLGPGWYDMSRPNTHVLSEPSRVAPVGQTATAGTTLLKVHWTGNDWVTDVFLTESMRRFATPAQATSYLDLRAPRDLCACAGTWSARTVGGVRLWQIATPTSGLPAPPRAIAGFRVGTDVFSLRYDAYTTHGHVTSSSAVDTSALLARVAQIALRHATRS